MIVPEVSPPMLEIAPSARGQAGPVALIGAFLLVYPIGGAVGLIPGWLALVGVAVFGVVGTFGLITALRSRGWGWVLRLDPAGVTVRDRATVSWEDVAEVVVQPMQPGWLFRPRLLRFPWGSRWSSVVAIVPRPGVETPPLRFPGGPGRSDRLGGVRQRRYGSRLVLMPHAVSASTEEILCAAQRWGHVTVSDRRPARWSRPSS